MRRSGGLHDRTRSGNEAAFDGLDEDLLNFVNDPNVIPGGVDSLEEIQDTGDFETQYSDAFIEAKG